VLAEILKEVSVDGGGEALAMGMTCSNGVFEIWKRRSGVSKFERWCVSQVGTQIVVLERIGASSHLKSPSSSR